MFATKSLDVLEQTQQFDGNAAAGELSQFRTMAVACIVYISTAIYLSGDDYATVLLMSAPLYVVYATIVAILAFCAAWIFSCPDMSLGAWWKTYMSDIGLQALCLNLGFFLTVSAFTAIKTNIPNIVPFYADPYLASIDLWLHGRQPWEYLHVMPDWVGGVIDFVYSRIWFVVLIGGFTVSTLIYRGAQLQRFVWSVFLIYALLGSVMAIPLSSVGPIFYDTFFSEPQFGDLSASLNANGYVVNAKQYANYLLTVQTAGRASVATGISAMPSLHVAFAVLTAWLLTGWGRRWATVLGWCYAAFIMIGSVYTGWHYAVDGYVSALLASGIWLSLSRYYGLAVFGNKAG